jgi:hypothetical protein
MHKLARHIFTLFLLVVGFSSFGQIRPLRPVSRQPPGVQQRIIRQTQINRVEAVKEKYIGQRLKLTSDESDKFWPIYRRYRDAIAAVRQKKRLNNSKDQPDGEQQIKNELYYEGELVNIRKFYTDEFLKVMPADKVSEMFKAEREFTDELIKQLNERKQASTTPPN